MEIGNSCLLARAPHARAPAPAQLCLPCVCPPRAARGTRHRVSGPSPPWLCCEAARIYSYVQAPNRVAWRQKARANSKREAVSISIKAPHARHDRLASLIVSAVLPFARISCPYPLSLFLCSARRSQVIIETTRKYVESMYPQRN